MRRRDESVHAAITVNFRTRLLYEFYILSSMFNPSFRGKQFSSLWWGRRYNCTSGCRYNCTDIKAIGVLNRTKVITVSKQMFLKHPQDLRCCHYSVVDQLGIDAQRRVSCRSRSELVKWQPQDSEIVKMRIVGTETQNFDYLANKIFRNVGEIIGLWHVFMSKQVLVRVFRFVAISQEKFEEMKQAQEVELANGTLKQIDIT